MCNMISESKNILLEYLFHNVLNIAEPNIYDILSSICQLLGSLVINIKTEMFYNTKQL